MKLGIVINWPFSISLHISTKLYKTAWKKGFGIFRTHISLYKTTYPNAKFVSNLCQTILNNCKKRIHADTQHIKFFYKKKRSGKTIRFSTLLFANINSDKNILPYQTHIHEGHLQDHIGNPMLHQKVRRIFLMLQD